MRDMFHEVLKFGSFIVDALVEFRQPVFVHIPAHGELRGGAWVVVDPTINADMMEMTADPQSRGGVLEPDGTVEIKFRRPELVRAMRRLDPQVRALALQLQELDAAVAAHTLVRATVDSPTLPVVRAVTAADDGVDSARAARTSVARELDARIEKLLPVYTQVRIAAAATMPRGLTHTAHRLLHSSPTCTTHPAACSPRVPSTALCRGRTSACTCTRGCGGV
jgi:acetyl-CoA carboxylase carboxyltransferase component